MARTPRANRFDYSRVGLGQAEEIRIGAYARRQLWRRIAIGAIGVLLIAGAITIYVQLRPFGDERTADTYAVRLRCESCGHTETRMVPFAQKFPIVCPKCGEISLYVLWKCGDCGELFVPERTGDAIRCPKCGSVRVGSATAK